MKGIVLAGGSGTRLQPLTFTTQKQLIPLANQPVIDYVIEDLRDAGVTEIGVVLGGSFPEQIQEHLGDGSQFGVDITYIFQGEPLGLAHAVGCAREFIDGDPFVVYFGDTIIGDRITEQLVEGFDPNEYAAGLSLQRVDDPTRFGIIDLNGDGQITRILEKPDDPPTDLAYIGVLAFSPVLLDIIEDLEPSWRGELELTQALHELLVAGESIQWQGEEGLWKDVGTPKDVIETNRILLEDIEGTNADGATIKEGATVTGPVDIGEGAVVEPGATIEGPASIGAETIVGSGTHLGPSTSIGKRVTLEDVEVESSVVLDEATLEGGTAVADSIIGQGAVLKGKAIDSRGSYVIGRGANISINS